jgi:hypothetical protein
MHARLGLVALTLWTSLGCEAVEAGRRRNHVDADGSSLYAGEPPWCRTLADVSDLQADHRNLRSTVEELVARRYAPGIAFIDVQTDAELARWFSRPDSFPVVFRETETAVHEGTHLWGFDVLEADTYSYRVVDDDLVIATPYFLDSMDRSAILTRHPAPASDLYADVYLKRSGDVGFNPLLDEFNAYVHGLAAMHCTRDSLGLASTSSRRAVFTFQFYVNTYLAIARDEDPAGYDAIVDDPAMRSAILTIWDRAEEWLQRTEGEEELSSGEDAAQSWVDDREIRRLR